MGGQVGYPGALTGGTAGPPDGVFTCRCEIDGEDCSPVGSLRNVQGTAFQQVAPTQVDAGVKRQIEG